MEELVSREMRYDKVWVVGEGFLEEGMFELRLEGSDGVVI